MSKSITKASAVMLAIMTLLSSIFVVQADAATGDKVTIAFFYCFDSGGNAIRYQQTTSNNGYTVGSAGEELCRITANGEEAYCIEPGHSLFAGDQLTEGSSSVWNSLGTAKQNAINLALLCGKPGSESSLSGTADEKWAATQLIVWEIVSDCRSAYGSYQCTNTKYIDGLTAGGANSGVKSAYDRIVSNMQTIQRIPSFAADSASNAKTYEMNAVNGGYSLSLYDGNSVLDKYAFSSVGGVTASRSGNTLTLTAKSPVNNAVTLSATRAISGVNTSLIAYGDAGLQDVVTGTSGITVSAYFNVNAKSGSLKLVKTSEDGIISGIQFTVTGTNYSRNVVTNANGEFVLNDIVPGIYTVTEKEDSRYEKQSPKMVKVESGKTAQVSFNNTLRKGGLKIIKTSEDGIVEGIDFVITGPNGYKRTSKSNAQGEIILSDLVPGSYMVAENADSRYKGQAPQIVMVEADKTASVTFKNILRKGSLKIVKTSEDGIKAGIEFTITGKNYSRTAKSDANGEILLTDLVPGTYTVTEKVDPRYEAQAPKTVVVQADKTAMVSFRNTLRKGNLKIIKTSEDGEIEGIQFVVSGKNYSKTVMTNAEGEMLLPDLVSGTYTVTEIMDERYEVQEPKTVIVEADKTATVSFKNTLRKGNLKIIKKSEDGIIAGIEFTVKGSSFNQTVKTNANGEMLLENLVPGVYTVTESVDDRYEPQAPKRVRVTADKTATVTFKNSIRKSSLKIFKISEDDIVADIEFTVTGENFKQTVRTNEDGEIALENLVPGTYTITESVNDRYEKQEPQTVTVEADKTATVTFKNTLRKGNLKIIKASEDGIVADILFVIKGEDYRKTAKSNSKGEIILPDLIPGTYTVTEKVDPRYEVQEPKTVVVKADETATVEFKNTLRKGDLKIVKTSEDGIVADIEFTITGKNYSRTAKSDNNGEIILSDLIPGTYTVTEKVDPRYEAQEPKTVVVKADETATVEFKNTLRKGDLKIIKTSEDGIIADIEFTITGKNYNRTAKSDKNGEIVLNDLIPGTYTVTEKVDPRYETQTPKTVKVEADKTTTVSFKNTLRKGSLKIIKTSEDGIVADIEFTITGKNYTRTAKSDKNGEIILADLVPGTYTVTEKVDSRYEAQEPKTVVVKSDETATVEFKNTLRKGNLKIIKTSEDSIVADIEFTITGQNYNRTAKSDKNGEIVLADLIPGTYTVTEKVDPRYETQEPKTVVVKADETATVEFKNTLRKGNLKIVKTSEDGVVADIEFTITGKNYSRTAKSDENGEIILTDLVPGTYTVTEKVDPRYEAQEPKTVVVKADETATVEFKNTLRKGGLKIIKTSEDGIVADIEFTIKGKNYSRTAKSDNNGEIILADLVPGTYTVTEKVDARYEAQAPKTVKVEADKTATVEFKNTLRKGGLKIIKTSEDGIVADIEFTITGQNYNRTAKSDKNGEIVLADLIPGTYTVTEKVDPRYETQASKTIKVEADKTTTVEFKNTLRKGGLKIIKTSEDGIVADIEFTITGKNYNRTAKSDKNGEIVLNDLIPGTYTVTEKVDARYEAQAPQTVKVEADKTTTVSFKNTLRKGDLKIIKTSDDGIIADIEFTITGKNYSRTAKSDKNGEIVLADLIPGTYTVTEKVDPRYEAQEPKIVVVKADETAIVEFKNRLRKGNLKIIKTSEDGIVADIEFTITGKNYSKTAKSDKNGEIVLVDLIPGTYTVTEKVDSRYETQEPKTVVVKADETATVEFKNTLKKWLLCIVKRDSETGNIIPYAGTAFQIYAPDGTLVSMNGDDLFTTNNEGCVITPEPLPYGKGYSIAEVKAPDGYVLDDAPVFFDVIDETTTEENGVMVIMIEKSDPPQKGRITVEKFGEVFADVILTENETSKTYQPVYSVAGLSGAVLKVYADEDITTPDGTVRVKKDTLAATLKTDENGKATSKQLYLGRYRIVEVKAPYGTVLNREPKVVELTYAGQNKKITTAAAEFHNDRQKVKIDLLKVMGIDERFDLGINNEVLNVTFGLFADEDITAANGNMIPKDGLIEIVSCDENGFAEFSTDIPFGSYYVQELITDEHYILSDTKYPVVFEYAGQDIDTVHIKVNDGEPIINEPKYGTVKGLKIDRETEETIEGAVFGLFKNGETVFTEDTAILTAISDENGIFSFENVPYGEYLVHEINPADGYIPNESNYPVTISEHEEVVEITAVNDRFPEIRTTAMIEGKKEVGATDVFTLEDMVEYKHLIPGKEYILKGILMDKATNAPFLSDGKEVTSEVVFTPEQANGNVTVSFSFNAVLITEETDIVVFENLYADGTELAVHTNIEDEDQTVTVKIPEIKTHAEADSKKEVTAEEKITIIDTVSYKNLTIGKEYTVKGVLMNKSTGKPFMVDDKEITAEVIFTAETADGNIEVVFIFDGLTVKMDTDVVVFETLYHNGIELTAHADIDDEDQTVKIRLPKIRTKASIDGKKEVTTNKPVTITDTVSFENLTVGKEYKLIGVLMDKMTGKSMTVNGNEITAEVVFTAERENGEIEVSFTFGGMLITKDIELVVFETLYRGDNEIAVHADISDIDQTVIIRPVLVPPDVPKTGDNTPVSLWIGLGAVALGAVIAFLFVKFRKKDEDDDE